MPKVTDTYERAYAACAKLAAAGVNPTVKTVAEAIGTNSPAIISPAIKDWKRSVAAESLRRLEIPEVPVAVADAASALWRLAVEQAQAALARQRQALETERDDWRTKLQQAGMEQAGLQQAFEAYRQKAEAQARQLRAQLEQKQAELESLQALQADTASELANVREANAALTAALAENRRQLERQQAEWTEKSARDHAWHLSRIGEERERAQAAAQEKIAGLEAALAQSRQHIAHLNGYLDQSAAATGELRGELKAMKEAQTRLLQELEAARQTLEAGARKETELEQRLQACQAERDSLQAVLDQLKAKPEKPGKRPKKTGDGLRSIVTGQQGTKR